MALTAKLYIVSVMLSAGRKPGSDEDCKHKKLMGFSMRNALKARLARRETQVAVFLKRFVSSRLVGAGLKR